MKIDKSRVMLVLYCNYKNDVRWRYVQPLEEACGFGTEHHPNQWVFPVWDIDKGAERHYAFSGIMWCAPLGKVPPSALTMSFGKPHELKLPE